MTRTLSYLILIMGDRKGFFIGICFLGEGASKQEPTTQGIRPERDGRIPRKTPDGWSPMDAEPRTKRLAGTRRPFPSGGERMKNQTDGLSRTGLSTDNFLADL